MGRSAGEKNIHTAIETSGFAPYEHIKKIFPYVDLWLWDVKAVHDKHKILTGVDDSLILENLQKISEMNASIILRCPLIPGVNDDENHLRHIAELANSVEGVEAIDLEPYHPLGENKSVQLGLNLAFHGDFVSESDKKFWLETICRFTAIPVRI